MRKADEAKADAAAPSRSTGKVRVRNIDYPLSGSINMEGKKPIRWTLVPNKWTEVPMEVYEFLKGKFANPREYDVPSSLPDGSGEYRGNPGQTRTEQHLQYLIEFQ